MMRLPVYAAVPVLLSIGPVLAQVARQDQANTFSQTQTFTGRVNGLGAASTAPCRSGTGAPTGQNGTLGDCYFQTNGLPGQNLWWATATGTPATWSIQTTSSSGVVASGSAHQTAIYASAGTSVSGAGPGTSGQVWTSNGASADPSFQTPGSTTVPHPFGASFDGGGSAIAANSISYFPLPYACTIQAVNIQMDDGTNTNTCAGCSMTFKVWKIAGTSANPTSTNSINTSGLTSAATSVRITSLSDFTTLAVTANDRAALIATAVSGAPVKATVVAECQ